MRVEGNSLVWLGRRLSCLYDGQVRFGADFFPDPRGVVVPDSVVLPVHAFLLQSEGQASLLIDSGSGGLYGAAGGGVAPALAAMGFTPEDIGAVFLTHLHGDHIGGLLAARYPCQRHSKIEPKGSAKCCHFGVGITSVSTSASIRATALITELAVARMLWSVRANLC